MKPNPMIRIECAHCGAVLADRLRFETFVRFASRDVVFGHLLCNPLRLAWRWFWGEVFR